MLLQSALLVAVRDASAVTASDTTLPELESSSSRSHVSRHSLNARRTDWHVLREWRGGGCNLRDSLVKLTPNCDSDDILPVLDAGG